MNLLIELDLEHLELLDRLLWKAVTELEYQEAQLAHEARVEILGAWHEHPAN